MVVAAVQEEKLFEVLLLMGKLLGMSRSVATVFAVLYSSETPCKIEEIAQVGGISKSAVSLALRDLMQLGLAYETGVLGERCRFYTGQADLSQTVSTLIADRARSPLDTLRAKLDQANGVQPRLEQARQLMNRLDHALSIIKT